MTRRARFYMVAVMTLALLAGCGGEAGDTVASDSTPTSGATRGRALPAPQAGPAQTHVLSESDNGKTVKANVGDRIRITMEECSSCGYVWEQFKAPDAKVVEFQGDQKEETTPSDPPMPGAPASRVFLYSVVGQGRTAGTLGYYPPGNDDPEKNFTFKVDASTVAGTNVGSKTWNFDEGDDETTVTIAKGDKVYVTLYEHGGTEEELKLTRAPDAKVLREDPNADQSTTTTTRRDTGGVKLGFGTDEIWGWDAVGSGQTTLEISGVWEFEDGTEPRDDPYRLTVVVKDAL